MPFIPKVEEKEEEIEDGTEKLIEYDQPERALNSYPVVYKKTKQNEFSLFIFPTF